VGLRGGPVLVRLRDDGTRATGVSPAACDRWFADESLVDHLIVEADTAGGGPFKAPGSLEPSMPDAATTVLACIGADAIGRVIADQCVHPMRVAAVAGCSPYERLTPERAATVLLDERGSRKQVSGRARFVVVVTRVERSNQALVDDLTAAIGARAEVVAIEYGGGT
jgi:probable selenium-dependent hydroxylase accessory protein YqeC